MTPIGKLTLMVIGLRLFGADGFLWGMWLGHILIDRSILKQLIKQKLNLLDDNIRILLPYKLYCIYNRIYDHGLGKIWGILLGALTFGWNGLIVMCLLGHFLFDAKGKYSGRNFRYAADDFWNQHLGKLTGGIIGFSLRNHLCLFIGIVIGFFIDEYRMEGSFRDMFQHQFWSKLNIFKMALRSQTAKDTSFIGTMAGLCAKIAKADGVVSENEIQTFKKLFNTDRNSQIARIFNEAKQSSDGFEPYAKQLKILSRNNLDMKESIIENLFKIGIADGVISASELSIFDKIAEIIEIPSGNYHLIKERFTSAPKDDKIRQDYEILGVFPHASNKEIKRRWIELINEYHPDKIQAAGGNKTDIEIATKKMATINNAYEHIMKQRKAG